MATTTVDGRRGYPWKCDGVTAEGREFLEEHTRLAAGETLCRFTETSSDEPETTVE